MLIVINNNCKVSVKYSECKDFTVPLSKIFRMKRSFVLLLAVLAILTAAKPQTIIPSTPKYEARAVWLTTIGGLDWPHSYAQSAHSIEKQKRELCQILDKLQRVGINQVLLQTRIRATTIYPSRFEPWDGCLSGNPGKSPDYDALAYAIGECHRRGMELHAWIVTIPIGKWNGLGCRRLRQRHPSMVYKIGQEGYMNPERAETAEYLADICDEIAKNYDIDGIHLDYIRYPETWKMRVSAAQGRANITRIVEKIHQRVKRAKPYLKISCSPIGKYDDLSRYWSHGWNAYSRVCQDAQGWLQRGLMDEIFPMMYFQGNQFFPFAIDWNENAHGRIVAPGLGIYFLSEREKNWPLTVIGREMEALRAMGMGHAYFRSQFLTDNVKGIYDYARLFDHNIALVPPMTWQNGQQPSSPQSIEVADGMLTWTNVNPNAGDTLFNIYAARTYPVDTDNGANLIAARVTDTSIALPDGKTNLYYAVTTTNRYGIESAPCQMKHTAISAPENTAALLECDGKTIWLSKFKAFYDTRLMLSVADMKGREVFATWWISDKMDVSRLPNGMYQLRTRNGRGFSHRIGYFRIKR